MNVGVVAVQGAVSEHLEAIERALATLGTQGEAFEVLDAEELTMCDGVILPGGESTSIAKLIVKNGLYEPLRERALAGMPVMGTCAGCVLLAKEGDAQIERTGTRLLGLMDMAVDRNAFGRQRESFEASIPIEGEREQFHAVFIRAPAIRRAWGECKVLASFEEKTVMARQGDLFAVAFHPELSLDPRIHAMFLRAVQQHIDK